MFLIPALGAWITDGLVLYVYFSSNGAANGNGLTSTQISISNSSLNADIVSCNISDCRRELALDNVLHEHIFEVEEGNKKLIHRSALQQDDYFAADYSTMPKNDTDDSQTHDGTPKKIGISAEKIESETGYLAVLAVLRLLLLTFPLSYAAFYGTKVPCVVVQFLFHGASALTVVSHMMAVLIIGPLSEQNSLGQDTDTLDSPMLLGAIDYTSHSGKAWKVLSLSLVSILLHFLIVLHVRSTGPTSAYEEQLTRKRKKLAYAMNDARKMNGKGSLGKPLMNGQEICDDDEEESQEHGALSPLLLPEGNYTPGREKSIKNRLMCLPDQFVSEAQLRLNNVRQMWSNRLEVVTSSNNILALSESNSGGMNDLSGRNLEMLIQSAATNASKLVPLKPDPFTVLLQLFAYENVWTNDSLDVAFATETIDAINSSSTRNTTEGSMALAFYAPQLLSFLLHGAYLDMSAKLEDWILKKCSQDLHFAHRCFWFLRAWCLCLGDSSKENKHKFPRNVSGSSLSGDDVDFISLEPLGSKAQSIKKLRGVEPNLYLSYSEGSGGEREQLHAVDPSGESSSSKFSPDERVLIEQLLRRVIECGSRPAYVTQYGSIDGMGRDEADTEHDDINMIFSPSALAATVEQGLVPVDPRTGWHSKAHLDAIASPRKYGFLPMHHSNDSYQKHMKTDDARSLFFAAPLFLDALLSIADDLMMSPRPNRTIDLRQRLRGLEVELLPSNVVYLPIRNMQHRVWRIATDESIALSTNERVPCIVALEVIDYGSSAADGQGSLSSERAITSAWVNTPREPKRHITLIDKVANFTQERLRQLEGTIDHLSNHGDGKTNLERRLSEYLGSKVARTCSEPVYSSNARDDLSLEPDEETPAIAKLDHKNSNGFEMWTPSPPFGDTRANNEEEGGGSSPLSQFPVSGMQYSSDKDANLDPPITPRRPVREEESGDVESPMGQWSTPRSFQKKELNVRKRNTSSVTNSIVEEEEGNEGSPQAKQRKSVVFPPYSENMARSTEIHANIPPSKEYVIDRNNIAPAVVFKEDWNAKTERLRKSSIHGSHPDWRLLPILVKSNDDLRQEQVSVSELLDYIWCNDYSHIEFILFPLFCKLMSQLIQRMALILARNNVPVWLYPYEIVALTGRGGIIECVPDTISIDSLKRNDPNFTDLKNFFEQHFGVPGSNELADAKANFVESLAAYSVVCYLMQIKDRHNGNILLTNKGRIVQIDWGFYFLSSPGGNSGFESAPFKLTRDFVKLMDGPDSRTFAKFRELCYKTFIELRKHCYEIILLVEMLTEGNEDLACFCGQPDEAVRQLKERFRLDLNDNGIRKYVDELVDESLENWRTRWYDRYQKYCVGVY